MIIVLDIVTTEATDSMEQTTESDTHRFSDTENTAETSTQTLGETTQSLDGQKSGVTFKESRQQTTIGRWNQREVTHMSKEKVKTTEANVDYDQYPEGVTVGKLPS